MAKHILLIVAFVLCACVPSPSGGGNDDAGSVDDDAGSVSDAGTPDSGPVADPCPDDACVAGCEADAAGLCVARVSAAFPRIEVDTPFAVSLLTDVCLGSSCTDVLEPLCDVVVEGNRVLVGGTSCWRDNGADGCSEDCAGADGALCQVPGLPAGDYVFVVDERELAFTVPMELGSDAFCLYPE